MVVVFSSIKEEGEGRQILGTVDLLSVSPSLNINLVYSYCFPPFPPFLVDLALYKYFYYLLIYYP